LYDARSFLQFADYTQLSYCPYRPAIFHIFQFYANPCLFSEKRPSRLFRSNLVGIENKRVKQIIRRYDPWSWSRSEAREASDVGFDAQRSNSLLPGLRLLRNDSFWFARHPGMIA